MGTVAAKLIVVCAASALLVAGCGDDGGGSDSSGVDTAATAADGGGKSEGSGGAGQSGGSADGEAESGEPAEIDKKTFVKRASAICEEELDKLTKNPAGDGDPTQAVLATLEAEQKRIAALGIPAGDESKVEPMLNNLSSAISTVQQNPKNITKANGFIKEAEKLADDYGVEPCLLAP